MMRLRFDAGSVGEIRRKTPVSTPLVSASTRFRPTSAARSIASRVLRTPMFSPVSSITRTLGD